MGFGTRIARVYFVVLPVLLCLLLQVEPVDAAQRQLNGLIVKLKPGLSSTEQAKVFAAHGGTKKLRLQRLKLDVVNLPPGELEKAFAKFKADPRVESVEVDNLRSAAGVPNDSSYSSQWALPKIGWDKVLGVTNPTGSATVAILDAGIDASHPDLAGKVISGTSILDGSDGRTDASGHGTMLAGIIAAAADNGIGIAGVAPAGVKVMPVTVLDSAGTGLDSNIIAGIVWAADHGADVILMPFSNPTFSQALQDAIDYAWSKGAVLVAATGNGGSTNPTFPAGDRGVVGVAATTQDNTLYSGANHGPDTFVVAPGVAIYSTTRGGNYGEITGTSASAAVVAGIASYMKAVDPTLTNGLIVSRLGQSADQNEGMTLPGYGLVNLADALSSVNMTPLQPAGVGTNEPFQDPYEAAGTCDKLRITSNPYTLTVGAVSGAIRVAAHNGNFNCQLGVGMNVVSLGSTSSNYKFYLDAAGTTEITQVTLAEGPRFDEWNNTTHDANIYYKDMNAGSPTITATLPGLANPTASQNQTVNPAPQTISFTSPAPTAAQVDGPSYIPTATGGASGNPVVFTIAPASASVCSLSGGVVSFRAVGSCTINANQAGNANYLVAPQVQQSFTVGKGNQAAVTLTVAPSTVVYGNTAALSASGGSGTGAFSFSAGSSTGCSVSGSTLTVTNASGDCSVTASKATDTNYLVATSAAVPVTLVKASQATVNVTAPASATYGQTGLLVTGSGGSGTGVFSYSANDSTACSINPVSGALTINSATGSCSVSATRVADNNYGAATSLSATVNLVKAAQSTVTVSIPSSAFFGESGLYATASGGSGSGDYSYAATGSACQINSSTGLLTISAGSGSCSVTATKADDNDYNAATSATASVTITKAPQAPLTAVITPSTLTYGSSASLTTTGGSGGGAVSFNASGSGCQIVNGTTLAVVNASGTCSVTATKAEDGNYQAATSAPVQPTLTKAAQATVFVTAPASARYGETGRSAVASGGSSSGSYTYSATGACSIDTFTGALTFGSAPGSCSVTASKPADDNYTAATSAAATINVNKALQPAITALVDPSTVSFGSTAALSISGGAGDGGVSFNAIGTGCQVSGAELLVLNASASCSVTATKATDDFYEAATSLPTFVTLLKTAQAPVTVSAPQSVVYRQSGESVTGSGGSGVGGYSYSASGACTVNATSGALTFNSGIGACSVTATKAADDNYTAAISPAVTITVNKAPQSTLTVAVNPSTVSFGSTAALGTSGGDGGGKVTFSASGTGCQVSGSTLSVTNASGSCSVTASKEADSNYEAASSLPVPVILTKADQATVSVSAPASAHYGETGLKATATGGSSSVSYIYSATGACSIDASSGALTFSNATGTCSVTATKPEDDNYNAASSAAANINVNKAAQPAFTLSVTPSTVVFGSTATVATSGGAGGGEVSYQVTGTGCQIVGTTLSVLNASGSCSVTATKTSDANYESATSQAVSVTLNKALQSTVSVSAPASAVYGQSGLSATASGGSGTGSYSYSASGACSVNASGGALSFNSTGTCSVTATKAADNNYSAASSTAATITVSKASQSTLTAIVTPSSVSYGSTAALTTSGGNGGGLVTFSASGTGCQVSGSTLSVTNASGTCSVTASKAADANYEVATSLPVSVTLNKADQTTVSVSAPASAHYGETGLAAAATGGSSSASYLYSATGACSIDAFSGALTFSNATGTCSVTATKPADNNYNAATSAAATINVNKAAQPVLTVSVNPSTVVFGSTATVATSGGAGDGEVSYQVTGTGCQIVGTTLSVLNASGSCSVTATKASDANYDAATSQAVSVTLNQALQSTVSVSAPASAFYGQSGLSATASGGSGTGSYSYSATGACTVNASSGALSFNATGTCSVTATKAADNNYSAASSTAATITVGKASQSSLTAIVTPSSVSYGSTAALTTSGGNGGGLVTFSATGTGCQVSSSTLSVTNASGTCSVTASKAADANYEAAGSLPVSVTLTKADQTTVSVSAPVSAHYGETGLNATASGGNSSASYLYSATGACSIDASSGALTFSNATGTCSVTATRPEDENFKAATSVVAVINVNKAAQPALTLTVTPSTLSYGSSATLSTTGGAGDGLLSFVAGGNGCQITGTTLSVTNASGSCTVTASKASDLNYEPVTSNTVTVTLQQAAQQGFAISAPGAAYFGQAGLSASVSGGSGGGGVSYSATGSTACSVNATSGAITITSGTGNCVITATKTADSNFSAASAQATVTITKGAQAPLTAVVNPATVPFGTTATLTVSGGSGGGNVSFTSSGGGCSVSGTTLSVISAGGSCSVTATKEGDLNYLVSTSAPVNVTLGKGTQQPVLVTAPLSAVIGETGLFAKASGGSSSGDYRYDGTGSTACSVDADSGALTITASFGSCSITAIRLGDANYNDSARSTAAVLSVGKADQQPLVVVVAPHPVPYGVTAALGTTGGSGNGAVSYVSTGSGCSVSGTSLTVNSAGGACSVTATKAADDFYKAVTSAPFAVTLSKGTQAPVTVTVPATARFQESGLFATASGGSAGAFSYSATGSCSVNSVTGALTINTSSGSCTVTATRPGDANYSPATATATLTATKGAQRILTANATPATVSFGSTATLSASGGDGSGTVTFDAGSSTGCTVTGTSLSVTDASGTCSVIATKAGDRDWEPVTSQALTVILAKGTQAAVTVNAPASARLYQNGLLVTASGGSGSGSFSYSSGSSSACSVDPATGALAITAPTGSCSITATRAGGKNYSDATSPAVNVAVNKALQTPVVTAANPAAVTYGSTALLSITGGSGTGAISFSAGSSNGCRVTEEMKLVVDNASGSCQVTATKLGDTEYDDATSAAITVTLNKATQGAVTVSAPGSASYNQPNLFATASGGSGTGAYIYSAGASNACQVNSSTGAISITSGTGTCTITATRGTDNNYLASAASAPASVNINKAEQNMLAVSAPATLAFGSTAKLSVVGGSTGGPVSYSAGNSTGCKVTVDLLSVTNAGGNCFVTATRAADPNFNATTSAPVEVKLERGAQKAVTVTAPAAARYAQTGIVARASGGDGTGNYSYSAGASDACSVDASTGAVTITAASGFCAITAARGEDINYLASAPSTPATIMVSKGTQPALSAVATPSILAYRSSVKLRTSGGAGNGAVTFTLSAQSTGCQLSGDTLTANNSSGSCSVTATKAADDFYDEATSAAATVSLTKATQPAVTVTAPATAVYGESGIKVSAGGGDGSGAYSYSSLGSTACQVDASGNITITSGTGDCVITAARAGDPYYFASTASAPASITVTRAQQSVSFAALEGKTYGADDFGITASSSSGLPLQFSSDNPAVATITPQGVIKVNGQGRATVTASQPGDLNYAAAAPVQQLLTVAKAVLTVKANDDSRAYGATDPLFSATFSGFVNGDTAAVISGAPEFSTDAQPSSPVGSYRIFPAAGSLEAANYSFTFQEGVLAIGLANQTITFNPLPSRSYGAGSFDLEYNPGASGNPVTFTSSDESVATVSGRTVTIKKAGSTQIIAYQAGTANYAEATAQQTLSVAKAQLFVTAENKERPYNSANPVFTFKYSGFVNGDDDSVVTGTPAFTTTAGLSSPVGSYPITITKGSLDAVNYSFTPVDGVLAVGKASQTIVFEALQPKTYGDSSFTLSAQGGPTGNPVTFVSSNTSIATVSGNSVTIVGAGSVTITANQNGNANYAPASAQQPLVVAKAMLTVRPNDASRRYNSADPAFSVSYVGFVRNETPATPGALAGVPAVTTEAKADSVPGSYPIIPALGNLYSTKYDFRFENGILTVYKGLQGKVTVTAPASASYAQSGVVIEASGGDGSGSYSFQTVNSSACSFLPGTTTLAITSGTGSCSVTATRAADSLFEESAPSVAVAIAITRASQSPVTMSAPQSLTYGSSATLSAGGGSGNGGVTFSSGSSTGCQVTGNVLSVTNAGGNCSVSAVKAADTNFLAAASAAAAVNLQRAGQGTVTVTVPAKASYGQLGVLALATGGSGTGAFSYSAGSSTACSVNASTGAITIISATGSCAVTATKGADHNYNASAASEAAYLAIEKADQALLTVRAPSSLVYGSSAILSASGGSGSGAVTFSSGNSTGCAVSGSTLTVTDAGGACTVTATKGADNNHNATSSAAAVVTLAKAVPLLNWSNPKSIVFGTTLSARELNATANLEGGSFVYTPPSGSVLPIGSGQKLTVTYTPSDTRNYTPVTMSVYITVESATKPIPIDGPPTGSFANMKRGNNFLITRTQTGTGATTSLGTTSDTTFTDSTNLKPNTIYQYAVASDADPTQTVFMTVRTPLANGWNIIAVPYDTSGTPVAAFFADRVSALYQWVPTGAPTEGSTTHSGSYVAVNSLLPGKGYFVKAFSRSTMLTYTGNPGPESATVTLKPGWTMIANPGLDSRVNIGERWLVDEVPLSIFINAGKIGGSIYWWNGTTYESWSIMQNNPQIEPWKGYWILNLDTADHSLTIK